MGPGSRSCHSSDYSPYGNPTANPVGKPGEVTRAAKAPVEGLAERTFIASSKNILVPFYSPILVPVLALVPSCALFLVSISYFRSL